MIAPQISFIRYPRIKRAAPEMKIEAVPCRESKLKSDPPANPASPASMLAYSTVISLLSPLIIN